MPDTHFAPGWMGGPYLPMPKAGLEMETLISAYIGSNFGVVPNFRNVKSILLLLNSKFS